MSLKEKLGEELYKQVQENLDDNEELLLNDKSENNYIPRERLNDKQDKVEMLESQLAERDSQIEQLKEDTNTTEELQNKIEELQNKNKQTQEELQQQLEEQKLEAELDKTLLQNKARNPKAIKALLDMESVELTDKGIKGLDDQLEELQEKESYLFELEDKGSKAGDDFKGSGNEGRLTMEDVDNMNEDEINENWEEVVKVMETTKK